ncbi:MAG: hypothetical protein JWP85_2811 [Rhodoglobus sp.]|nr:hypothetical protein [Rhodoglobus sp.]
MLRTTLKRSLIILVTLLQVVAYSRLAVMSAYAEDAPAAETPAVTAPSNEAPAEETPAPAPANNQGPTTPPGPDGKTYKYNPATGLYENDYYTWNPTTGETAPKQEKKYSYNPATGVWDTTEWRYDAPSGQYVANKVAPAPTVAAADTANPAARSLAANAATSPDSTNALNGTSSNAGAFNLFYNASISNSNISNATTGNATVAGNTLGGNAGTGNASDMATIINMLQSVWDPSSGQIATFTANIDGDVTGDLFINPGPGSSNSANGLTDNKLKVNQDANTNITNDINLAATSGDANVDSNTEAGDATTGTANAVANVVNMLNSYITTGQSFVGTVNINGNLDGDILLPEDMLTTLLASNVPRTTINTSNLNSSSINAAFNDTTNIVNNVTANAGTGDATVAGNTSGGSATSGNANSNVTILNLTGRDIIGSNAMLVFVNVLGQWVGMIMDAPGATSAVLGGGITQNNIVTNDADIHSDNTTNITNNIKLAANTGDANVTNNSKGGNAKTGDATASANIANVSNSKLSLGGWFGLLFINVFGNWHGSFGVNTDAGNKPVAQNTANAPSSDVQVFKFVPNSSAGAGNSFAFASVPTSGNLGTSGTGTGTAGKVLGAATAFKPVYKTVPKAAGMSGIAQYYIAVAVIAAAATIFGKLTQFIRRTRALNFKV